MTHRIIRSNEFFLSEGTGYRGRDTVAGSQEEDTGDYRDRPPGERYARGVVSEGITVEHLRQIGEVKVSSVQGDRYSKIDAFIRFGGKSPSDLYYQDAKMLERKHRGIYSVQIKFRTGGRSDIGIEVLKDFDRDFGGNHLTGRDMIGDSELYAVRANNRIGLFFTRDLKNLVHKMYDAAEEETARQDKDKTTATGFYHVKTRPDGEPNTGVIERINGAELRVTKGRGDKSEGVRKLLAYIPFDTVQPLYVLHV